jgi:hypothetical protein
VAVNDTKIKYSRMEDLKEVLRLVMVKVGLRANNWPQDEEKAALISHIINHYGGHTPKEILLAFDMALNDQLEFNEGESIICYENFSCQYFSSVMNAYRRWAESAKSRHDNNFWRNVKELDKPKESMSEQTYQEWYDTTVQDFKDGKIKSIEFLPPMLADWLIQKGEIDHHEYYKRAAVMIGKKLATESITDKVKMNEYVEFKRLYENAVKNNQPFTGDWVGKIERLAKQIALNNHIQQGMEL